MTFAKTASLALILAASFRVPAAHAAFYTGEQVYTLCTAERGSKDYVENTYECIAYITGAVDAFNTTREAAGQKSCIPAEVTIDRLRAVTVEYLRDNPESRAVSASKQVFAATRQEWPCEVPTPAKPVRKKRRR